MHNESEETKTTKQDRQNITANRNRTEAIVTACHIPWYTVTTTQLDHRRLQSHTGLTSSTYIKTKRPLQ